MCLYLGIEADVVPPGRVKDVVTFHDLLEHLRLVIRVERLVTAQAKTQKNANRKSFLADRTIGRAFGTLCRLSVCRL